MAIHLANTHTHQIFYPYMYATYKECMDFELILIVFGIAVSSGIKLFFGLFEQVRENKNMKFTKKKITVEK